MSELLRLQEWLGFHDALRYLKHIGLDSTQDDFLHAYAECGFPLKIKSNNPRLYVYDPHSCEEGYPYRASNCSEILSGKWEHHNGYVYRQTYNVEIADKNYQSGYSYADTVWIRAIVGDVDFDDFEKDWFKVVPAYWKDEENSGYGGKFDFFIVNWGMLKDNQSSLLFSRKHIEEMFDRVRGVCKESTGVSEQAAHVTFCDSSHESYPPELHAALLLWEGLYIKGEKNPNHPHQQAATKWLEKNQDKLPTSELANAGSDAMIKRLVTVTTPSAKKAKK